MINNQAYCGNDEVIESNDALLLRLNKCYQLKSAKQY